MKRTIYILGFTAINVLFFSHQSFAQYETQLVQFSQAQSGASARIQGLGNAQTALGGDFSSISANPAGLGMFTKSEISLSPTLNNAQSSSSYFGNTKNADKSVFGLDQIGAVFYSPTKRQKGEDLNKGWLSVNFGIGYNKTQNFNQTSVYSGINPNSTVTDYFAALAAPDFAKGDPSVNKGEDITNNTAYGAYKTLLVDYNKNVGTYTPTGSANIVNGTQYSNAQEQRLRQSGSQSEFGLGIGGNYENKLYIGGSLNFTSINYTLNSSYSESGSYLGLEAFYKDGQYDAFHDQTRNIKGSGINLKFGAIMKPSADLRVGLSFATPTWYRMSEAYNQSVASNLYQSNSSIADYNTQTFTPNEYSYNIRTPYKLSAGLSYIIAKKAIFTADVDFIDYKSAKFTSDDYTLNQNLQLFSENSLQATANYRAGLEVKLNKEFMIRGGYNFRGSPYSQEKITSSTISGGLGYRVSNFAIDLTYMNTKFNTTDKPYDVRDTQGKDISPIANINNTVGNFVMTMGFSF